MYECTYIQVWKFFHKCADKFRRQPFRFDDPDACSLALVTQILVTEIFIIFFVQQAFVIFQPWLP